MASAPARTGGGGGSTATFESYRSILRFASAPSRTNPHPTEEPEVSLELPPWRRQVGAAFFLLDSRFAELYGEDIPADEENEYAALILRTFRAFGDEKPGSEEGGLVTSSTAVVGEVSVDSRPRQTQPEGHVEVVYRDTVEIATPSRAG